SFAVQAASAIIPVKAYWRRTSQLPLVRDYGFLKRWRHVQISISEWLNLIFRWVHVFAAIMWVGQTFLFTWMDRTLNSEESLWMVHSGGFYIVNRQKIPKDLPQQLHWFRWEAAVTWMSGLALLITVYYA